MNVFVLVLFILIFFGGGSCFSQEIIWQKTVGGGNIDILTTIHHANDKGVVCGGFSYSPVSGNKSDGLIGFNDYWIVKIDSVGNLEWQNDIGGNFSDELKSITMTSDGGYLCGGTSSSGISGDKTDASKGGEDYWLVKLNSAGSIEWQKTIGGSALDEFVSIAADVDGGFICGGYSNSMISGDKTENSFAFYDFWIVKIDSVGNILWQNTIFGSQPDHLSSIRPCVDGGYICGGTSYSSATGDKSENPCNGSRDFWILKLDSIGNIQWQNTIGGNFQDYLSSVMQTPDGGFICGGSSNSLVTCDKTTDRIGGYDQWIVKLDSIGNIEWQRTIGSDSDDFLSSIEVTVDGGFICSGHTLGDISGHKNENSLGLEDFWIVRLDSSGEILWSNVIGGIDKDYDSFIVPTLDSVLFCGGSSSSTNSGDKTENSFGTTDYWILKLNDNYNTILGESYFDTNFSQTYDSTEIGINQCKVRESQSGRFAFTNEKGAYSLIVADSGSHIVSPMMMNNYFSLFPVVRLVNFSFFHQVDSFNDFAIGATGVFDDLCMTITPLGQFRPGFNGSYMLNYENVGTTTQSPTIVFRIFPNVSFVSSSITPSAIYTDSVVWNLSSLSPFQTGQILVTVNLSPTIPIGTILNSYAQIFPIVNDANPSCNNATWEVTVTGSFDPNDISVDQDTLYSNVFPNPPFLDYLIRFQNTGTDTAFTVKILNPIDTMKLDLNSLEFVAASHPMEMRFIYHERNMEFLFNNILLPDSNVNEPASHGFVRYKIKPKSNLQVGDSIKNFAAIYFDFNEPVITNTVKTKILLFTGLADQISTSELFVYPNPSSQEINIQISNTQGKRISLDVYNLFGQKVKSLFDGKILSSELKQQFDISTLNQGVYLLQYNVDGVTKSKKIIKW